jgi:Protein of unknown function (DUF2726)
LKAIPSQYLFLGLLLLVFFVAAAARWWRSSRANAFEERVDWPFYAKKPLTQPEQVLYHRLVEALPEHLVLAQVQVSRVLGVKKGFNFHEWNNRVNRLSYDFVICAKDARVLAVIELDDKTHNSPERMVTDDKKDRATASAGLRLIRWHVASLPDEVAISQLFGKDAAIPDILRASATD